MEKYGPLLSNTYTVLGTSQNALYKLTIPFVLHHSPWGHKESETAEQLRWTDFDIWIVFKVGTLGLREIMQQF